MTQDDPSLLLERIRSLEKSASELQSELARIRREVEALKDEPRTAGAGPPPDTGARERQHGERRSEFEGSAGGESATAAGREEWRDPGATSAESEQREGLIDLEYWLGGRGLLLVGVVALVFAVGFLVKYALDRGWIVPLVRVLAGAGVGVTAIVLGDRLRAAGYRVYGLWLAAGGFGAVYVSIWAAVMLYGFLTPVVGFALMVAVVSVAAVMGMAHSSEAFVALAAFGGYMAPLLLRVETPTGLFGLTYLAGLSGATLWVAVREDWHRLATLAVGAGILMTLATRGGPDLHGIYLVAFSTAGFLTARREGWPGLAAVTVILGWVVYYLGRWEWDITGLRFAFYASGLWLTSLIAWIGVRDWTAGEEQGEPLAEELTGSGAPGFAEVAGGLLMLVPPLMFFIAAAWGLEDRLSEPWETHSMAILALALGLAYVAMARSLPDGRGPASRRWRYSIGFFFWLIAPPIVIDSGIGLSRAWLLEGAALTAAGIAFRIVESRTYGLISLALAVLVFLGASRPEAALPFVGLWALTGLGVSLGLGAWAYVVRRGTGDDPFDGGLIPILYLLSGLLFLGWGTGEIRFFYAGLGDDASWFLARELTISGFWMAYAACLLLAGFILRRRLVRWAGLGMAFITAAKVFVYDLSNLSQLYRITSFFALAIVLLVLAFLYQRGRDAIDAH